MSNTAAAVALRPGRRLETPAREKLLADYARSESFCKAILQGEFVLTLLALGWIIVHGHAGLAEAWPWIAFCLGALGIFRWIPHHYFLNKKRLDEIRPDARFGEHTRDSLVALSNRVFLQLGFPPNAVPVFLTRDKEVNAGAVRCELWPGLHLFNGVFLNRSTIHLLDEAELASVIGHELGHVFPYASLLSRCYLLHSIFAGLASMTLVLALKAPGVAFIGTFAILWLMACLIHAPQTRLSRGIEFLCDDFGAQTAGLLPSLSAELKIAVEAETRQRLLLRLLRARQAGQVSSVRDLFEAYEEAVPFGKADAQAFERDFQKYAAEKRQNSRGISLGGFLEYLQGEEDPSSADEWVGAQMEEIERLANLPVLPLDRGAYLQGSLKWTPAMADHLAGSIERHADSVLVQLSLEIDDRLQSHPGVSRRILFLWRHRTHYPQR